MSDGPNDPKPLAGETPKAVPSGAWLSNANNLLTALGAAVAAVAAIFSTINKGRIDHIAEQVAALDVKGKQFDYDQKKAGAIKDFATLFLDKVLADAAPKGHEKHNQALLSILDIVAQASGKADDTDAKSRAVMPLQLALLFNEPGALAGMDMDCRYLDAWVAMACADNSDQTRVTAIQALVGICQRALREGRLELLWTGIQSIDQLIAFIPQDQVAARGSAIALRSQLASSIQRDEKHLAKAQLPKGDSGNADEIRKQISNLFANPNEALLATQNKVDAQVTALRESKTPDNKKFEELQKTQVQLETARAAALQVAVQNVSATTPSSSTSASSDDSPDQQALTKLIKDMASTDDRVRHQARSVAALFGQKAVKRLLQEVAARSDKNSDEDYKTRLGVAVALKLMPQPIEVDKVDASAVVSLLESTDSETRIAAAEFLMNLESGSSVLNCFDVMERLFNTWSDLPKDKIGGNAVKSAAGVLGTWARVITPKTPSREANTPFPQFALAMAEKWKTKLEGNKTDWAQTIATLNDLIRLAQAKAMTSASQ